MFVPPAAAGNIMFVPPAAAGNTMFVTPAAADNTMCVTPAAAAGITHEDAIGTEIIPTMDLNAIDTHCNFPVLSDAHSNDFVYRSAHELSDTDMVKHLDYFESNIFNSSIQGRRIFQGCTFNNSVFNFTITK